MTSQHGTNLSTYSSRTSCSIFHALFASMLLCGCLACHGVPAMPAAPKESAAAQQVAILDSEREQLAQLPQPSKSRYLTVRSLEVWENPYLTVQPGMVTVHVLRADENPDASGKGGLLRPTGARRQDLNVSLDKLAEAVSSVPGDAWPYGRVVAVEEAHNTPKAGKPQVRRNMEAAIKTLNDLGVVVYEWNGGPK